MRPDPRIMPIHTNLLMEAVTLGTSLAAASASEQTNYQVVQEGHGERRSRSRSRSPHEW